MQQIPEDVVVAVTDNCQQYKKGDYGYGFCYRSRYTEGIMLKAGGTATVCGCGSLPCDLFLFLTAQRDNTTTTKIISLQAVKPPRSFVKYLLLNIRQTHTGSRTRSKANFLHSFDDFL